MGAADSVPGVSGGTMALIVGIYERLLESIGQGARALVAMVRLDGDGLRTRLGSVEWGLLVPLLLGIVTALAVASRFILDALDRYPSQALGLFLGLVAGSLAIPWRRMSAPVGRSLTIIVLAAVVAFVLSGLPSSVIAAPSTPQIFFGAMVAICAMILPGVSGAYLLKVIGIYEPTLAAVRDLDLIYVATFVAGAVIGLGTFAVILVRLLSHRHDGTMAVLLGLMAGSLRALWPWQTDDRGIAFPSAGEPVLSVVMAVVVGVIAVTLIERIGRRAIADRAIGPTSGGRVG
jgi:putative membrane protein